jgi:hypothetical protein
MLFDNFVLLTGGVIVTFYPGNVTLSVMFTVTGALKEPDRIRFTRTMRSWSLVNAMPISKEI